MIEAFGVQQLVQNLPLQVTAVTQAERETLIVGTADGALLRYEHREEPLFAIQLRMVKRHVSQLPISSLQVIQDQVVALINEHGVQILSIPQFQVMTTLSETVNASAMAVYPLAKPLLAVAVKKKLHIFEAARSNKLTEWTSLRDLYLSDHIVELWWIDASRLVLASSTKFILVHLRNNSIEELRFSNITAFKKKSSYRSLIVVKENRLLLTKGNTSVLYDLLDAEILNVFVWPVQVQSIAYQKPYLIALLAHGEIQARSLRFMELVQSIQLKSGSTLVQNEHILIWGSHAIWRLLPYDLEDQIDQFILQNRYDDAQRLLEEIDFDSMDSKIENISRIKALHAQHIFHVDKNYALAIDILESLRASPLDVIHLYPQFREVVGAPVDTEYGESAQAASYPASAHTNIPEEDLGKDVSLEVVPDEALYPLMDYLSAQRAVIRRALHEIDETHRNQIKHELDLLKAIDTVLFHVYLKINDSLLSSLLRMPNDCDVDACAVILKEEKAYGYLVELWFGRGLHAKSLKFLTG